jgi:hypothetical protein
MTVAPSFQWTPDCADGWGLIWLHLGSTVMRSAAHQPSGDSAGAGVSRIGVAATEQSRLRPLASRASGHLGERPAHVRVILPVGFADRRGDSCTDAEYAVLGTPSRFPYEGIVDELRASILDGRLGSGERLPSENELSRRYDTSRPTVRRTIALLKAGTESRAAAGRGRGGRLRPRTLRSVSGRGRRTGRRAASVVRRERRAGRAVRQLLPR